MRLYRLYENFVIYDLENCKKSLPIYLDKICLIYLDDQIVFDYDHCFNVSRIGFAGKIIDVPESKRYLFPYFEENKWELSFQRIFNLYFFSVPLYNLLKDNVKLYNELFEL